MFKESAVHNVSSPITQGTPSPSTEQSTPFPRSPSQNRGLELRRVSSVLSGELSIPQPVQDENEESNHIQCEGE